MTEREEAQRQAFLVALREDPYDAATHAAFADWLYDHGLDDEAHVQAAWTVEKMREAEAFFTAYAASVYRDVAEVLWAADRFLETGYPVKHHGIHHIFKSAAQTVEFWGHYVVLTGRPVALAQRTTTPFDGCCQNDNSYGD